MTIPELEAELEAELASIRGQLAPLCARQLWIGQILATARSKEFIRVNGITRADVQRWEAKYCESACHWTAFDFGEWMKKTNCQKTWCVWNGLLHLSAELMAGRLFESVARYEDIPEEK